jgi:hypothetical protein
MVRMIPPGRVSMRAVAVLVSREEQAAARWAAMKAQRSLLESVFKMGIRLAGTLGRWTIT